MPKLLGIDYGTKRVGVALTDQTGSVAFPHGTFSNDRTLLPTLVNLIRKENISTAVVGESRSFSGKDNPVMSDVREFVKQLEDAVGVTIRYEPEYYSSVEARKFTDKGAVDAEAAAIILNSYIERTKKP